MKKVVTIGGGTGHYTILRGLKNYDLDLIAIVNIIDNGGSSGELRVEFGILPPGDIRNCLLALSDESKIKDLMDLFEYRFPETNSGKLSNHNLGNLILTALIHKYGDIAKATKAAASILNISGKVLPASINSSNLFAKTFSDKTLSGESQVGYPGNERIKNIWLEPPAFLYKDSAEAIRDADLIIICPGDLYASILPNLLITGMKEAIKESKAKVVYLCNLVTKQGTHNFKASDFVNEIEKYLGRKLDFIICNNKKPDCRVVDKYLREDSHFVECDLNSENIIKENLLVEHKSGDLIIARHNTERTAEIVMGLLK